VFNQPGELSLVECRHSLAGSLAVGLRGHSPRLVGHHLPRDARQSRMFVRCDSSEDPPSFWWNWSMSGSKTWGANDRTGGPIDDVLRRVRGGVSEIHVERLVGTWSADDDNVSWIRHADAEVQVDTLPGGALPALVETDSGRHTAVTVEAATSLILAGLGMEDA